MVVRRAATGALVFALAVGHGCGSDASRPDGPAPNIDAPAGDGGLDAAGSGGCCSIACPTPSAGHNSICGRIVDLETGEPIEVDGGGIGHSCADIPPAERTGPCLLDVLFYDALGFAQNPPGTLPLTAGSFTLRDCGCFAAIDISTPALGFLAVLVEDADAAIADDYAPAAVALAVAPGDRFTDQRAWGLRWTTDSAWTADAGDPFGGQSFIEKGIFFRKHLLAGAPVEGIVVQDGDPSPPSLMVHYFRDQNPDTHASIDPEATATGPNGAALLVNASLVSLSAAPCDDLAKSIPGILFGNECHLD